MARPWNYYSHVAACPDCNGTGHTHANRAPSAHDPYPARPCDCGLGEHLPECGVCGFTQEIAGFDCFVCDTVAHLYDADLRSLNVDDFAASMRVAINAALRAQAGAA